MPSFPKALLDGTRDLAAVREAAVAGGCPPDRTDALLALQRMLDLPARTAAKPAAKAAAKPAKPAAKKVVVAAAAKPKAAKPAEVEKKWHSVDATDLVVGRAAVESAP